MLNSCIITRIGLTRAFSSQRCQISGLNLRTFDKYSRGLTSFSVNQVGTSAARPSKSEVWKRLALAGTIICGTALGLSAFTNRETRDGLSVTERQYLHTTFYYMGAGLGLTATLATVAFRRGWTFRLMSLHPLATMGIMLAGSWISMMGTMRTNPSDIAQKHLFWASFMGIQAIGLGSLCFLAPQILIRAGFYTAGIMGALTFIGATAKEEKYLYIGGPLMCGMVVVALATVAPFIIPAGSRTLLMASEAIYLYGGLGIFACATLYHTQQILHHARMVERGMLRSDPCGESLSLYMDFVNIFMRLVWILSGRQQRR